ncbi:MAG: hypothetical protein JSS05_01335 [Proteobacteria bacterium]|nr:hypothetical protein [Pseudomonadota bacterium]
MSGNALATASDDNPTQNGFMDGLDEKLARSITRVGDATMTMSFRQAPKATDVTMRAAIPSCQRKAGIMPCKPRIAERTVFGNANFVHPARQHHVID